MGYVAAMGVPGGGRNPVDPRFISLFSVFNITFPSDDSLKKIYTSILAGVNSALLFRSAPPTHCALGWERSC